MLLKGRVFFWVSEDDPDAHVPVESADRGSDVPSGVWGVEMNLPPKPKRAFAANGALVVGVKW